MSRLLALLVALALVAAACGDDDDAATTTAAETTTTAAETTTTAADTTTTTAAETTTTTAETTTTTSGVPEDWPDTLVFGFVPSQEVEELQDDVDTFANVLSEALGIDVEGVVTTDYTGLGTA
ncbi:MAG: PhnD/SsuA/transferrin family substrate-binding protein, partial [Acidimicrobiia bacterium]|nr:PhnD/SsuA/transferrin family substrate-binding protein [Acidimicrobiia bacterium]